MSKPRIGQVFVVFATGIWFLGMLVSFAVAQARSSTQSSWTWAESNDPQIGLRIEDPAAAAARGITLKPTVLPDGLRVELTVPADLARRHWGEVIQVNMPWVKTQWRSSLRTYGAYRGGVIGDWPNQGFIHSNSSQWPGLGFSPLMQFYDSADGSGVQVVAWNDMLSDTQVGWVTSPDGQGNPFIRFQPYLDRGQSFSATIEMTRFGGGMPDAALRDYRERFLLPWAKRAGISEAKFKTSGPWSMTNWPVAPDRSIDLVKTVQRHIQLGSKGYIQWATAEGQSQNPGKVNFEPDHRKYAWFGQFGKASELLNGNFGCLIAPQFMSVRGEITNLRSTYWQQRVDKLRDDLKAGGARIVYWDAAQGPAEAESGMSPYDWLGLIADWRQKAGITVAAESSCDLAVFTGGAIIEYFGGGGASVDNWWLKWDMRMARIITPNGTVFVQDHSRDGWCEPVQEKALEDRGFVPILTEPQLVAWATKRKLAQ